MGEYDMKFDAQGRAIKGVNGPLVNDPNREPPSLWTVAMNKVDWTLQQNGTSRPQIQKRPSISFSEKRLPAPTTQKNTKAASI